MQQKKMMELATSVESGPQNEDRAAGSEGEGVKKRVECEILAFQETSSLSNKLHEGWCEELAEDGAGPRETMGRTVRWHRAHGEG